MLVWYCPLPRGSHLWPQWTPALGTENNKTEGEVFCFLFFAFYCGIFRLIWWCGLARLTFFKGKKNFYACIFTLLFQSSCFRILPLERQLCLFFSFFTVCYIFWPPISSFVCICTLGGTISIHDGRFPSWDKVTHDFWHLKKNLDLCVRLAFIFVVSIMTSTCDN